MSELEIARKARTAAKGKFTRARNSLNQAIDSEVLVKTIENRYSEVKEAWKEVQAKHENYIQLADEEGEEGWIIELHELFDETEIRVDEYLDNIVKVNKEVMEQKALAKSEEELKKINESKEKQIGELLIKRDQEDVKFHTSVGTIKQLINPAQSDDNAKHVVEAVRDAQKRLKDRMISCDHTQENYITALSNPDVITSETTWIANILEIYDKLYDECNIFISTHGNSNTTPPFNKGTEGSSRIRLEKLRFQSFSGELRKYPSFKAEFVKYIKPLYMPHEEAFVLKSYLASDIKEDVDSLGDDIDQIWKRLDSKYGDEGKLVDSIMSDIKCLGENRCQSPTQTLQMIKVIERAHRDLKRLGMEKEISNSTIVGMIEKVLPKDIEDEWIKIVTGEQRSDVGRDKFPALLQLLLKFKERIEYRLSDLRVGTPVKGCVNTASREEQQNPGTESKAWCWLHPSSTDHPIWRCKMFKSKSSAERLDLVRKNNACFACLEQGHIFKFCKRNFKCREEDCCLPHHRLLHEAHVSGVSFHGRERASTQTHEADILLQLQRVKGGKQGGKFTQLNVLWDGGSTLSFITFHQARKLRLTGHRVRLQVVKVGGEVEELDSFRYDLVLVDKEGSSVTVSVLGIQRISTDIRAVNVNGVLKVFEGFIVDELNRPEDGQIDCLIGYEYAAFHPVRLGAVDHLLLLENRFGKVIGGTHPNLLENTKKVVQHAVVHHATVRIEDFYTMERLGVECSPRCGSCKCGQCHPGGKNMTLKEEREYKLIEDKLIHKPDQKKWEAGYPWIKDPKMLPNNKQAALGALKATEKRLQANPDYGKMYCKQINDMIDRGAARKLSEKEMNNYGGPVFYISHHEVLKPESKSTPCRIVFNSSANYRGHILNDYYAKGPDMLNNLVGVLLRFREKSVAMIGDIGKMYHSIDIPLLDQMTHRFLWRELNVEKQPDTYVMTSVNMGDRPSGTMAMVALRKTAEMSKTKFPRSSETILTNSYMDDIPESTDTIQDAMRITKEIDEILEVGGFKIKGWIISGKEQNTLSKNLADQQVVQLLTCSDGDIPNLERVLGMGWVPNEDVLRYKVKLNFSAKKRKIHTEPNLSANQVPSGVPTPLTKRQILSQVNGVYDPLGLISPFTVRAKIMLRKLWGQDKKLGWDDPIPENLRQDWINFFQEFFQLEKIVFSRCMKPNNAVGDPVLVIFSDGSGEAYGAVAYVRWLLDNGEYEARLVASKNRIAPVKIVDIVRLELAGAVISKRLRVFIQKEVRFKFAGVYHIVDSEIVKAMIGKESYGFNTFAANRIGEIQQQTDPLEWYWISGNLNVADWLTRGKSPIDLDQDSLWQKGPEFLRLPVDDWPVSRQVNVVDLPERNKVVLSADVKPLETLASRIDIDRFSKIGLLKNTTARVLKLYKRYKRVDKPQNNVSVELSAADIQTAEEFWILDAQRLIEKDVKAGKFVRLCPRYRDGLIVVGGRAERWMQATWNRQEFIFLPYEHRFSTLVAEEEHAKGGHLGVASTVARIRARYWIVSVQKMVKSICSKCVTCRKKFNKLSGQIMGSLPIERLQPAPPFSTIGVDFFGPFTIRGEVQKRTRGKCYGVIFTCFVSRAVHIDISKDYSTDSFLQVMRRFSSMRGWPCKVHSDNGTQLVAASKELKGVIEGIDKLQLQRFSVKHGTDWQFTPADAPWMNGVTESLVKSVKKALNAVVGDQIMDFSELQTVMFEVSQIVNQRPIGRHPTNPEDGSYLCPNDLLLGRASSEVPQGPFRERVSSKYRLDYIQQIVQNFWKKWTRDYFPGLLVRQKWHVEKRNMKVGDVVVIQDTNAVRGEWKLGIVTKVHPSSDNMIRRVTVSYKNQCSKEAVDEYSGVKYTNVERPVHRLIVLVANDPED